MALAHAIENRVEVACHKDDPFGKGRLSFENGNQAMPVARTTKDSEARRQEFEKLRDAGWLRINLAADPHYPTQLFVVQGRDFHGREFVDEYAAELLHRALGDAFTTPHQDVGREEEGTEDDEAVEDSRGVLADEAEEILLRPANADDKLAPGVALYRIADFTCQIIAKQTPQANSVLGRIGVLDILQEQLENRLRERGIQVGELSLAEVIRLSSKFSNQFEAVVKQLERLTAENLYQKRTLAGLPLNSALELMILFSTILVFTKVMKHGKEAKISE